MTSPSPRGQLGRLMLNTPFYLLDGGVSNSVSVYYDIACDLQRLPKYLLKIEQVKQTNGVS
jgi:hypothetical protein